jgi:hypothetical protein
VITVHLLAADIASSLQARTSRMSSASPPDLSGFWQPERTISPTAAAGGSDARPDGSQSKDAALAEPIQSSPADGYDSHGCGSDCADAVSLQGIFAADFASLGLIEANPSDLASQLWAERQALSRAEGRLYVRLRGLRPSCHCPFCLLHAACCMHACCLAHAQASPLFSH